MGKGTVVGTVGERNHVPVALALALLRLGLHCNAGLCLHAGALVLRALPVAGHHNDVAQYLNLRWRFCRKVRVRGSYGTCWPRTWWSRWRSRLLTTWRGRFLHEKRWGARHWIRCVEYGLWLVRRALLPSPAVCLRLVRGMLRGSE